jgi:hypothetical protein
MEFKPYPERPDNLKWMTKDEYECLMRVDFRIRFDYANPICDSIKRQEDNKDGI